MATIDQLSAALINADKAGDVEAATTIATEIKRVKNFQAGQAAPGAMQGLASAINGPLFGFGDEVLGGIGGAIDTIKNGGSFGENYIANRERVRGMQARQREENPFVTGLTQAMASAPTMLIPLGGAASAAKVTGMTGNALNAAKTGAIYGAISGAGNSTADGIGGTAMGALEGAGTGAALGGVLSPATAVLGAGARNVGQRFSQSQAAEYARQKVAEALSRDARGAAFTTGQVNPLGQAVSRFDKMGPEAMIVDAGGRNTNQLLDTLATLPGRTKDAVFNAQRVRQAGVGDRMRTSAETALGTQGQRLSTTVDSLIEQRATAAAPLYNQLRQVNITPSQELTSIIQAADELGATAVGRQIATANRQPFTIDAAAPSQWNMGQLDYVKQGIDQLMKSSKAMDRDGKLTPLGYAYQNLSTSLKAALDAATTNPQTGQSLYRNARDAFAGPSALIDAANRGRSALTRDEATISNMVTGLEGSELQAFRIGAFEALRNKLGMQGGQTEIMNMWKNPSTREKLKALFGDERAYRSFAADVAREASLKRLQGVGAGSQTATRQAGMGDLDVSALADAGAALGAAKTGNLMGVLGSASNAWNRISTPQTVRDQMGGLLLSQGPQARTDLLGLGSLIEQINRRNAMTSTGAGLLGSQIGTRLMPPIGLLQNQ